MTPDQAPQPSQPSITFLTLEDEIDLRIQFKRIIAEHGCREFLVALGEINASLIVGLDVWHEHEESRKGKI